MDGMSAAIKIHVELMKLGGGQHSLQKLARITRVSWRTVMRSQRKLRTMGWSISGVPGCAATYTRQSESADKKQPRSIDIPMTFQPEVTDIFDNPPDKIVSASRAYTPILDTSLPSFLPKNQETTSTTNKTRAQAQTWEGDQKVVVAAWNAMALQVGLQQVRAITPKRKDSINQRLKEHGLDGIIEAIDNIGRSDFCHGKSQTGWKADFDFLLQSDSLSRAREGRYANRQSSAAQKQAVPGGRLWQ